MTTFLVKHHWVLYLIPIITGIIRFQKLDKGLKLIFYFAVLGFVAEMANYYFVRFLQVSNSMPVGHIYYMASFLLLGFYYLIRLQNYIDKRIIIGTIITFEIFAVFNGFFIEGFKSFPSISGSISALTLIVFSILLYAKIMKEAKIEKLSSAPVIWINSAILVFYTSHFFYLILFNLILDYSFEFSKITIQFKTLINAVFYQIFTVAFIKTKSKS